MPDVQAGVIAAWGVVAAIQAGVCAGWGAASQIQSNGSSYTPAAPSPSNPPVVPGNQAPGTTIPVAAYYPSPNVLAIVDLRDDVTLEVVSVSISLDDESGLETFRAQGKASCFAKLTAGAQPATVKITVNGVEWRFIVETIDRDTKFADNNVSFGGRSLAAVCDAPYQFAQQWIVDAPTTANQLVSSAQAFTGVEIVWLIEDWYLPPGSWSFQGTPMDVVRAVAAAVGAVVEPSRTETKLTIRSRYAAGMPNEWPSASPDVQIAWDANESESYVRADRPAYDGVFVAGQAQGALALVRLAGCAGSNQAPMVTDPLLTDPPALRERGLSVLGAAGKQAEVTRVLPLRTGGTLPGLIERSWLARFVDPTEKWEGVARSRSVSATHKLVRQTVSIERHTEYITGSYVPPPPPAPPGPTIQTVMLMFEGLCSVGGDHLLLGETLGRDYERIENFYNGGNGGNGSAGSNNWGLTFSASGMGIAKRAVGGGSSEGGGNFSNEPSPTVAVFFYPTAGATLSRAGGLSTGVLFSYSSIVTLTVSVYSEVGGTGTLLASSAFPQNTTTFNTWSTVSVLFTGVAKSVVFVSSGVPGQTIIDNLELGILV